MGRHGDHEVTLAYDQLDQPVEEGVEVPLERIDPQTLRRMVAAFVSREWSELADGGHSLDDKVEQVLQQLRHRQAKVVFDLTSETWNIIPI
jgi:uncharacterized protein